MGPIEEFAHAMIGALSIAILRFEEPSGKENFLAVFANADPKGPAEAIPSPIIGVDSMDVRAASGCKCGESLVWAALASSKCLADIRKLSASHPQLLGLAESLEAKTLSESIRMALPEEPGGTSSRSL